MLIWWMFCIYQGKGNSYFCNWLFKIFILVICKCFKSWHTKMTLKCQRNKKNKERRGGINLLFTVKCITTVSNWSYFLVFLPSPPFLNNLNTCLYFFHLILSVFFYFNVNLHSQSGLFWTSHCLHIQIFFVCTCSLYFLRFIFIFEFKLPPPPFKKKKWNSSWFTMSC